MKLDEKQKQFIRENKDMLISIFDKWIEDMKDELIENDDPNKDAVIKAKIREFRYMQSNFSYIDQKEDNDEDNFI